MQTGQTNTGSSGPKEEFRKSGSDVKRRIEGLDITLEHERDGTFVGISKVGSRWGWSFNEGQLDDLIAGLKKAKREAFPKPLKPLCPSSAELLRYLQRFDAITPLKAREELGIEHLPRRIKDLKEHGHKIKTTYEKGYNGKRYARYSLEGKAPSEASGLYVKLQDELNHDPA